MSQSLLKIVADFTVQLSSSVAIGDTTATLSSATDDDSVSLPSGLYGLTIDNGQSNKEYIVCSLSGTALTAVKSITRQGVQSTGFTKAHRRGAKVSITDWAILDRMLKNLNGTTGFDSGTNLGYDAAPTALTGNQFATVNYVLSVVSGGTVTFDQQVISNQTSGEALAINDVVYFKESDQLWYKADADLTTTFDQLQIGINKTTAGASGVTIQVAISGPVSGFTGLTAGSKYYLSNTAGAITTTAGTYSVFVGWALSTTSLLFNPILKTLPTQKEKDAMTGSSGVPSSTNKYRTQDNSSAASTDQTQTTQNGTVELGEADSTTKKNKIAQSFIPVKTKIRGVNLYKSADTGTFTGTVTISIQADSAGAPSGTALATKTYTNLEWTTKSVGAFETIFTAEYGSLTTGSTYWIVGECSTSDSSNHPNFGTNTAGGYSNGSVKYKNTTDGWTAIATIDLYFSTMEGNANQGVSTDSTGKIPDTFIDKDALGLDKVMGTMGNTYTKTYFTIQVPFINATAFTSWINASTTISPGGLQVYSVGGTQSIYLAQQFFYKLSAGTGGILWGDTKEIVLDWWQAYVGTGSDTFSGFGSDSAATFTSTYASTTGDKCGFAYRTSDGKIYMVIAKNGVGATTTQVTKSVTLTNWNNYRVVLKTSSADFYINGELVGTMSGANFGTAASSPGIGFGKNTTGSTFQLTAPTISLKMNP